MHSTLDHKKEATKENIVEAFKQVAKTSKPEDIIVIYLSGHGVTYGDPTTQFHYLTKGVSTGEISDSQIRTKFTISTEDLTNWINAIPAQKQLLILDACSSGQAVDDLISMGKNISSGQIKAFDRMKDRTGMFIITGSAADKKSYEASQYGQSLLTHSLLSGLHEISAQDEFKMVDLLSWLNHSKRKVPDLARSIGGIQEPVISRPRTVASFDIAQINNPEAIPLAQIKPVFVQSTLMDLDEQDDILYLSKKIDDHFRSISSKGKRAGLIFFDVKEFPNAHSIKGYYSISNEEVTIDVTLRKGSEKLGKIIFAAPKSDTEQIIKLLVKEIDKLIK